MQYLGGKSRIARQIAEVILAEKGDADVYREPFLGGASVAALLVPHFKRAYLSDAVPDVVLLWEAALAGREFPETLSRAEWEALRDDAEPSALRGFAGFGVSFGGKWFAGYAKPSPGKDYAGIASRAISKKARGMEGADLSLLDYRTVRAGEGEVVYCDPPYAGTTEYGAARGFDPSGFWTWAVEQARNGAVVFVSEYAAPEGWRPVWSREAPATLAGGRNGRIASRPVEHLFTYDPEGATRDLH